MTERRSAEALLELRREVDAIERRLYELRTHLASWEPLVGTLDLVVCQAGEERFAFLLGSIERFVPVPALTRAPEMASWIPGLLSLRGAAIPVIDVAARIKRAARMIELSDLIAIASARGARVGLLVEAVHGTLRIDAAAVQPPAENMPQAPYVRGSITDQGRVVHLLDVESFAAFSGVDLGAS